MVAGLAVRHAFVRQMQIGHTASVTQAMQPAQFDADTLHWAAIESVLGLPFYSPRDGSTAHRERLALRLQLARAAGPWWALDGLAIVSERPLTRLQSMPMAGCTPSDGPALAFGDGFTVHAWHGVTVDREVIEAPETITIEAIDGGAQRRAAARPRRAVRVRSTRPRREVERFATRTRPVDSGNGRWARSTGGGEDEPLVVVEVLNSTPEADGSRKTYFLRVPPADADGPRGRRLDLRAGARPVRASRWSREGSERGSRPCHTGSSS